MFINFSRADARNIATLRSAARRRGLRIEKSRVSAGPDNVGGLRITDDHKRIIAGWQYDLTIREARQHLRDRPTLSA